MAVAVAIVETFTEQKTMLVTLDNSARSLLLQYQALANVPLAQAILWEAHESELFQAAEDPAAIFSEAEILGARAALLRDAKALAAQSQAVDADAGAERVKLLNSNNKQLSAAIAIIKTYEP